jgi:glutathione synthase/RimK-type ligase-like ATP-grasp enzyme
MLLIITNTTDLACDYLILRLRERRIPFARFNTDLYPESVSLDIKIENDRTDYVINLENGKAITSESVKYVYFRQPIAPTFTEQADSDEKAFAEAELTETLRSLWRVIPERLWLNHPVRLWSAINKVEQLLTAKILGFNIPNTLISSDYKSIRHFFAQNENKIIAKAVKHGFTYNGEKVLLAGTQQLNGDFLKEFDNYAQLPMTYQSVISKEVDIRVVVVGSRVFATRILTENSQDSSIDWRITELKGGRLSHERIDLPDIICEQCLAIVRHFGLRYSSIDMVKDREGRYYFLELNPNGQWAWIEQITGFPIRDAIIDTLITEEDVERIRN